MNAPRDQARRGDSAPRPGARRSKAARSRLIGVVDRDVFFQFREASHLSEREVKARIEKLQRDARMLLTARGRSPRLAGPPDGRDRIPRQGDPRPGRDRPADRRGRLGRPARDGPRPEDEGGRPGPLAHRSGARSSSKRLQHHGREAKKFRLPRRRHREAVPRHRRRASWRASRRRSRTSSTAPRASPSTTPTRTPSARTSWGRETPSQFALGLQRGEGLEVHPPRRHRDVLHPRAEEADDRAGERARLPAELLQQLLRADEGDGVARDRPHMIVDKGLRVVAAPPLDRHRPLADRQQPGRHEGRQRARSTPSDARRRRSTRSSPTRSAAGRRGSSAPSRRPSPPTARPS